MSSPERDYLHWGNCMIGNLPMCVIISWGWLPGQQCGLHCLIRLLGVAALQAECSGGPGSHRDCDCCWADPHSCSCRHLWNEPGTASSIRLQCEASDLHVTPPVGSASKVDGVVEDNEQMKGLHEGGNRRAQSQRTALLPGINASPNRFFPLRLRCNRCVRTTLK